MIREWNNSTLSCLLMCGERCRRRYIDNEISPSTLPQVRGHVVHAVAAAANRIQLDAIRDTGLPLPAPLAPNDARDMAATMFNEHVEFTLTPDERANPGLAKGRALDCSVTCAAQYVTEIAPRLYPVAIEERVVLRPQGSGIAMHGTPDLVCLEVHNGHTVRVIRDTKTSMRTPRADVANSSQQMTFYTMLDGARAGHQDVTTCKLDYVVYDAARKRARVHTLVTTRSRADVSALINRLNAAIAAVEAGVFLPAPPGSWYCTPAWCEYYTSCDYVSGGEVDLD